MRCVNLIFKIDFCSCSVMLQGIFLCTFKACSGEMLMSESSSFSTQRLSWDSSSNTPSIVSTSQANQTYEQDNYKTIMTESSLKTSLHLKYWCFEYTYLCTEGLALDKGGRCISRNPVNQGREQTTVSMVTQGILYENRKQQKIVFFICLQNSMWRKKQTGVYKTVYYFQ